MPLYDYHCTNCNKEYYDVYSVIADRNKQHCPICAQTMRVLIGNVFVPDACFLSYHSDAFGQTIHSKSELRELIKKHNVEDVGCESPDKLMAYKERCENEKTQKVFDGISEAAIAESMERGLVHE